MFRVKLRDPNVLYYSIRDEHTFKDLRLPDLPVKVNTVRRLRYRTGRLSVVLSRLGVVGTIHSTLRHGTGVNLPDSTFSYFRP